MPGALYPRQTRRHDAAARGEDAAGADPRRKDRGHRLLGSLADGRGAGRYARRADRVPPAMTRLFITVLAALLPLLAGAPDPRKPAGIMGPAQPGGGLDPLGR